MSNQLHLLFSTPIGVSELDIPFTYSSICNEEYNLNSDGVLVSKDKFILNKYRTLHEAILREVHSYARSSMACDQEMRITQSWAIKSNSSLQFHQHPNSIISGAFYVSADSTSSEIRFLKPYVSGQIKWETNSDLYKNQDWLWDYISFKPHTGKLILFPSYVNHGIVSNNMDSNRCVLSFNTWFKNPIGSVDKLTFLD